MLGDGSKDLKKYATTSERLKDDFIELCLKLGKAGTVSIDDKCFKISITDKSFPQLGNNRTKQNNIEYLEYNDKVFDVTVPNHTLYIRRNGKVCWSGNCFGPRQRSDSPYAAVIASFLDCAANDKTPIIHGDGGQFRDFTYVENAVHANILAATHPDLINGESFNVGTGSKISINEVYMASGAKLAQYVKPRAGDVRGSQASIDKISTVLGYRVLVDFEEGMKRTREWHNERAR